MAVAVVAAVVVTAVGGLTIAPALAATAAAHEYNACGFVLVPYRSFPGLLTAGLRPWDG